MGIGKRLIRGESRVSSGQSLSQRWVITRIDRFFEKNAKAVICDFVGQGQPRLAPLSLTPFSPAYILKSCSLERLRV